MSKLTPADVVAVQTLPRVVAWLCPICGSAIPENRHGCECDGDAASPWGNPSTTNLDPFEVAAEITSKEELRAALATLSASSQDIIRRRYGLDGHRPQKLDDIARDLGLDPSEIRERESAALRAIQAAITRARAA